MDGSYASEYDRCMEPLRYSHEAFLKAITKTRDATPTSSLKRG